MDEVRLTRLDGAGVRERFEEIQAVYVVAFPGHDLADHRARTMRQASSSGFEAVIACTAEGRLVGFVYGLPLSPASTWWEGLEPAAPEEFTRESGTRTVAVIDLAVLPSHRGRGLGRRLLEEFLSGRREERATLATDPEQQSVQEMYERWGWRKVGRVPGAPGETLPAFDLYVKPLRSWPAGSGR